MPILENLKDSKYDDEKGDTKHIRESINSFIQSLGIEKYFQEFNLNFLAKSNSENDYEFDCISVFKNKNKKTYFFFECKNYEDKFSEETKNLAKENTKKFLEKLESYVKNNMYVGNDEIFCIFLFSYHEKTSKSGLEIKATAHYWNKNKISSCKNLNSFLKKLNSRKIDKLVHITPTDNFMQNICSKSRSFSEFQLAFNGKSTFKEINLKNFINLKRLIDKNDILEINGPAGSGKTTIAFYLFGQLEDSVLQIININFWKEINKRFEKDFLLKNKHEKTFWNSQKFKDFLENDKSTKYLIIDEYQRSTPDFFNNFLKKCIKKKIKVILLGDFEQSINPESDNPNKIQNALQKIKMSGASIYTKKLYEVYRLDKIALNEIKYLFYGTQNNSRKTSNYQIEIKENWESFYHCFSAIDYKKHLYCIATIQYFDLSCDYDKRWWPDEHNSLECAYKKMNNREYFLYIREYFSKYIFSPYDVISREIDYMFLYLPKSLNIKKMEYLDFFDKNSQNYLKSQINVLTTRATKGLIIFSENEETKELLKSRLLEVEEKRKN